MILPFGLGSNALGTSKIYDKQNGFNFEIVNFSFLGENVPSSPSDGVLILQFIRFAEVCFNASD